MAERNKASNEAAYNKWLEGITPDQIRIANNARRTLNRHAKKRSFPVLPDYRRPKRALTAFLCYVKDRFESDESKELKLPEAAKILSQEFKSLSLSERKVGFYSIYGA